MDRILTRLFFEGILIALIQNNIDSFLVQDQTREISYFDGRTAIYLDDLKRDEKTIEAGARIGDVFFSLRLMRQYS